MSMYPQARSQSDRPDPAGASRTGGAPLRRFTGTSLPNGKVSVMLELMVSNETETAIVVQARNGRRTKSKKLSKVKIGK